MRNYLLSLIFGIFLIYFALPSVSAQVLFLDDFNDGNADGWVPEIFPGLPDTGQWSVQNGRYRFSRNQGSPSYSSAGDVNWADYVFEVDVTQHNSLDTIVFFRFQDVLNAYDVNVAGNMLHMGRRVNGVYTLLSTVTLSTAVGSSYTYKIVVSGENILVYINNNLEMSYNDIGSPLLQGKIALGSWPSNTMSEFDNVRVSSLPSPGMPSLSIVGVPTIGSIIQFSISDPFYPNADYIFGMAIGTSPGITLPDGRIIPLNPDFVLMSMLVYPSLLGYSNTAGTLDGNGNALVTWNIPNLSGASGITVYVSFVTADASIPQIFSIAPAVPVTLI